MTFERFWPIYLAEHRHPRNRRLHVIGTVSYLLLLAACLAAGGYRWLPLVPAVAYGCAWSGHFLVERNRPATFSHPWLSLRGDHKMAWLALTGRLEAEYRRTGIRPWP